jgi:hypothetical protein
MEWLVVKFPESGTPHPVFFVSVASKGFSLPVSLLFATLARELIGVAGKGFMVAKSWRERGLRQPLPEGKGSRRTEEVARTGEIRSANTTEYSMSLKHVASSYLYIIRMKLQNVERLKVTTLKIEIQ